MSLHVPPDHVVILKRWLELPSEDVAKFSAALEETPPYFNATELAKALVPRCNTLDSDLVFGIVQVLISVYRTGEPEKPFDTFLDRFVRRALRRAKTFSEGKEEEEWSRLRGFLLHALLLEKTIGTTAKAGPILTEHERIFDSVKILTDFRPIFHVDASEAPDAGVIVHMLKITQRDKHDHKVDTYFALDTNDIAKIKAALDRATEKEEALRKRLNDAGLAVLDVQAYY